MPLGCTPENAHVRTTTIRRPTGAAARTGVGDVLGVVWDDGRTHDPLSPSLPAARYPIAGSPVVARTVDAAAAVAGDVVVVSTDSAVRAAARSADASVSLSEPADVAAHATTHDHVLVVPASVDAPADVLETLADRAPAVAVRDDGHDTDATAHSLPADAFADHDDATLPVPSSAAAPVSCDGLYDVRRPWELLAANERALERQERTLAGAVHPDATCRGAVVVEEGAHVDAGVVLDGPVFVGSGATVGPNAYVRGATCIDVDSHVGHGVEVKNSVIFPGAAAPHLSYVGDSVLGPGANLGAGSVVANLRHDGRDVAVAFDGQRVSSGRRKFGAVVGADARLGIGTRVNAGVTVGADATTVPGETVMRDRGCQSA